MSNNNTSSNSQLLDSRVWDDCVEARLLRPSDPWSALEFRSYWHTLRRLFGEIGIDAVLCIENRPTVCLKDCTRSEDIEVEKIRKKLWNLGATTLFVVERKNEVQVFSTIAKPTKDDPQGLAARLDSETVQGLKKVELALRLQQFVRRVETGAIYRDEHKSLFNPKTAVDRLLLENLKELRNLICGDASLDAYRRAHNLIGKFLFSCYLLDRGIIGPTYLNKNHLPKADDMLDLLRKLAHQLIGRGFTLNTLFAALQHDFNGSLFDRENEDVVTDTEFDFLIRFLTGENLRTRQLPLFKLYDFSFVPIELISSIYQEFIGAEAEAEAPVARRNQLRNHTQRIQGAYYTPPRLAELTVDIATEDWDTLLNKRCLDPACGSGIFLVILFIRMAEESRNRNPDATPAERYNELTRLLSENLCGVDIHHTACLVTCFSLYLAFLDQMEPKEITELREVLERTRKKILPRILWERGENPPPTACVRELNFFEMKAKSEFDLVIGNPPWVSRRDAAQVETWIFDEAKNPAAKSLKKTERNQTLFPNKEQACAFMWKARLHARDTGRVCQLLPSRVFLSNNTDRFQHAWLNTNKLESVWLLADYRFILFSEAICPTLIACYHSRQRGEAFSDFDFITPKVELIDPREAVIDVQPEDQKKLDESKIVAAAEHGNAAIAWKQDYWGTPRDKRLIERLIIYPKLDSRCARPPRMMRDRSVTRNVINKKQWWKGQGFQPITEGDLSADGDETQNAPWPIWWDKDHKFLSAAEAPDGINLLKSSDYKSYGSRGDEVRRTVAPELCRAPMLLINKACTKFLFSDFNVLFQDDFLSISAPWQDEDTLLFLLAFISSPLAQYFLFHTTANIGVERPIPRVEEMLQLPLPLPKDMPDQERSQVIIRNCANLLRKLKQDLSEPQNLLSQKSLVEKTESKLTSFVYEYFDICEWESFLIEDTVRIFRPSATPSSFDAEKLFTAKPSREMHREEYAKTLVATFQGWTRTKDAIWTAGSFSSKYGLALLTMGVGRNATAYEESKAEKHIEELLQRLRKSSAHPSGTLFQCLRGFIFFEGTKVHLLKPLSRRHWTRTAALNDADSILTHMIQEDGWGK